MNRVAAVVQFPHPGGEHVPKGALMPWNTAPGHRRKFMISPGTTVDDAGGTETTEVLFWGEWEPPSRVVRRWPPVRDLPTVLHRPCVADPPTGRPQNTDPWVFGDAFLYSNCKQLNARPMQSPSALQRLGRGSVILFGSASYGRFVLDTVFVVGQIVGKFVPADEALDVDPTFRLCTVEPLAGYDSAAKSLTLFRGATHGNPIDGMFSFVPCIEADDPRQRFERPAIELPGILNPASRQAPSGAKVDRLPSERRAAWTSVVDQVRSAGLGLAVRLTVPGRC